MPCRHLSHTRRDVDDMGVIWVDDDDDKYNDFDVSQVREWKASHNSGYA